MQQYLLSLFLIKITTTIIMKSFYKNVNTNNLQTEL